MKNYKLETNTYGNLKEKPEDWVYFFEIEGNMFSRVPKNIPSYKVLEGFHKTRFGYQAILEIIVHSDFVEEIQNLSKKKEEKELKAEKKLDELKKSITPNKIAECIYSVNKEAKRQRDIQRRIAESIYEYEERNDSLAHSQLHKAKSQKEYLYFLKEKALRKLIEETKTVSIGYHEFPDMDMDMYEIEGFQFHLNECLSEVSLGEIEDEISADRKRSIPPKKAISILEFYIK